MNREPRRGATAVFCVVKSGPYWILAGMIIALSLASGCKASEQPPKSSPPVPTYVAFSPQTPSDYKPARPMRQLVPGLMVSTMYISEPTGRHHVEIWDLLVGAGKKSDPVTLPGAAVIEIAAGQGVFTIAGKPHEARMGNAFSIDEGQSFTIVNRTQGEALMMRATVIRRAGS